MGILGKVIGAGASLIGTGAAAIGKTIENAFLKQERKNLEYLSTYPYKYKYILREVKHKMDDMNFALNLGLEQDFFVVYNCNNEPILVAKSLSSSGTRRYIVQNMNSTEVANIECKKALFSSSKQNCIIDTTTGRYEIGTSISFDKRKFSLSDGNLRIECSDTGKEIKIAKQRKVIMQFNKIASDLGMKWGEYVIGCNDKSHEEILFMFAFAIGIMLVESDNLLDTK